MNLQPKLNVFFFSILISGLTACGGGGGNPTSAPLLSSSIPYVASSSLITKSSSVVASSSVITKGSSVSSTSVTNSAPIADAGIDQNVSTKTLITLNGSASTDVNGDTLTYRWSLVSVPVGSLAGLSSSIIVSPTFTPDIDGEYVAQLIVSDGKTNSVADILTIVAKTPNSAPIANAGVDQNVSTKTLITLNGLASSDTNGDVLTYQWSLTSMPAGSSVSLSSLTTVSPTFTPDIDGTYSAQLIVNDGKVDSSTDTVTVIASKSNSAPIANADVDQSVNLNTVVNLNGSKSTDADSDGLSYQWVFVSKPTDSTATLDNAAVEKPTFRADIAGSYVLSLVVSDGLVSSKSDNVQIEVIQPSLMLYEDWNNSFTKVSFPYSSTASETASITGIPVPTTHELGTFKLKAQGKNFTIINVSAKDTKAKVVPYFSGISENLVIVDGTEVEFKLVSPLTKGATTNLIFSFKVFETGETFTKTYIFTSN